jgi:hypothetical protein
MIPFSVSFSSYDLFSFSMRDYELASAAYFISMLILFLFASAVFLSSSFIFSILDRS